MYSIIKQVHALPLLLAYGLLYSVQFAWATRTIICFYQQKRPEAAISEAAYSEDIGTEQEAVVCKIASFHLKILEHLLFLWQNVR